MKTITLKSLCEWLSKQELTKQVSEYYIATQSAICAKLGINKVTGYLPGGESYTCYNRELYYANWETPVTI